MILAMERGEPFDETSICPPHPPLPSEQTSDVTPICPPHPPLPSSAPLPSSTTSAAAAPSPRGILRALPAVGKFFTDALLMAELAGLLYLLFGPSLKGLARSGEKVADVFDQVAQKGLRLHPSGVVLKINGGYARK